MCVSKCTKSDRQIKALFSYYYKHTYIYIHTHTHLLGSSYPAYICLVCEWMSHHTLSLCMGALPCVTEYHEIERWVIVSVYVCIYMLMVRCGIWCGVVLC